MTTRAVKKWLPWVVPFILFAALMLLLDSCMQFRMSKTEINEYFSTREKKGTLHQYRIDNRVINYLEVGDTALPLVIFVHGSPGSLSAFIDFMSDTALLARAQLITVDRPGFGSSNFGYAEPSLQKQAEYLKPILLEHHHQRPVILVGHSLGGPLIARMAMDYPELVDGLVMVAPSIDPALEPDEWFRAPLATPFLSWILPRSLRASNEEIYHLKPELETMIPLWPKVHATTIVIQGTEDTLVPKENANFARKMITNAPVTLEIIDGMDHFVPWGHPELIRKAVLDLVSKSVAMRTSD